VTVQNVTTYIVQASPLTRIFLPEWQDRCLADPSILTDPKQPPFKVFIPRPCGAIELIHNKPTLASSILPRSKEREVTEDEVSPLVLWLTGEQNSETDIYGIVDVPIQDNIADTIMALIHEGDEKKRLKLIEDTRKEMAKGISTARERADARVMRACGKMYNIVKATVEDMKKNGQGVYAPSYSEALAFEVMKKTIAERRKPDERAAEMLRGAMTQLEQPV
jgi:hypothetical protein